MLRNAVRVGDVKFHWEKTFRTVSLAQRVGVSFPGKKGFTQNLNCTSHNDGK